MDDPPAAVTMTITPRTSTVLHLANTIAARRGHDYVGTEHLLLALLEEGDGIAGQVLMAIGAADAAKDRTERILASAGYRGSSPPEGPSSALEGGARTPPSAPLRLTVPVALGVRTSGPPPPADPRPET